MNEGRLFTRSDKWDMFSSWAICPNYPYGVPCITMNLTACIGTWPLNMASFFPSFFSFFHARTLLRQNLRASKWPERSGGTQPADLLFLLALGTWITCPRKWFRTYTPSPWNLHLEILLKVVKPLIFWGVLVFSFENTPISADLISMISVILAFLLFILRQFALSMFKDSLQYFISSPFLSLRFLVYFFPVSIGCVLHLGL